MYVVKKNKNMNSDEAEALFADCKTVRLKVFCNEQGYSEELEFDEEDKTASHLCIYDETIPIATGRLLKETDKVYRAGRIAVLKQYRGNGTGKFLMETLTAWAKESGADVIRIGAQVQAAGFYERQGFVMDQNDTYMDGHVPHLHMSKVI